MGKTYKLIICGKKGTGKTTILENLIYNNGPNCTSITSSNSSSSLQSALAATSGNQSQQRLSSASSVSSATSSSMIVASSYQLPQNDKYFSTIEDMYVACWEKDKGLKEKFRFYDTKGLENAKDVDTINFMRHLFSSVDGAILVFSSYDADSAQCIERLKSEIEKSKDKKETCHFIIIDNTCATHVTVNTSFTNNEPSTNANNNRELIRQDVQNRLKANVYELNDKRENLYKPFIDLFTNITQIPAKGSMNIVQSIKKPKVFSSK